MLSLLLAAELESRAEVYCGLYLIICRFFCEFTNTAFCSRLTGRWLCQGTFALSTVNPAYAQIGLALDVTAIQASYIGIVILNFYGSQ